MREEKKAIRERKKPIREQKNAIHVRKKAIRFRNKTIRVRKNVVRPQFIRDRRFFRKEAAREIPISFSVYLGNFGRKFIRQQGGLAIEGFAVLLRGNG